MATISYISGPSSTGFSNSSLIGVLSMREPRKIKVTSVENVVCIGFVRDMIHRLSIVNVGIGDIDVCLNLRNDIKKRMSLDSAFCAAELCPPEKTEAEVNCRGIKSIKLPVKVKWCINPFILRNLDEFPGKLLKYAVILVRVCLGKVRQLYLLFAKSKMVGLLGIRLMLNRIKK